MPPPTAPIPHGRGLLGGVALNAHAEIIAAFAGLGLMGLWLGSLEIDRFFPQLLSAYWGVYGIGLIAVGFLRRIAFVRHAGLALLLLTLGYVALVDTARLEGVYRPLSFVVIGLIFVATSVTYARLSPRLEGQRDMPD